MKVAAMAGISPFVISAAKSHSENFEVICCLSKYKERKDAGQEREAHRVYLGRLLSAETREELDALHTELNALLV